MHAIQGVSRVDRENLIIRDIQLWLYEDEGVRSAADEMSLQQMSSVNGTRIDQPTLLSPDGPANPNGPRATTRLFVFFCRNFCRNMCRYAEYEGDSRRLPSLRGGEPLRGERPVLV